MGNQQGKERRDYGRKIDWKNAECPAPPGKPYLVPDEGNKLTDVITIRWSPPTNDGGAPVTGYLVEHRRTGSAHWLRATPHLVQALELPLTGLEPGWRYQFRVSAENDVGRSEPGELSEPLTVTPQKWAASAPFFNVELQDTIGLENEKVEFKVQVIAIPTATISWYKDGFEIFSSRRTKIVTENDQSSFIIHQAALEDEGEIKCTATNRAGHAVTRANLKLEAPPRMRLPRQYEDGLIFEKGELIRLKVTTAGRPKPHVAWYHNGELIQNGGRYEIVVSETGSTVRISEACREDRGEYMIKGVNKIGEDVAAFLVTVTDRPSPPGKVEVTTHGRRVTLSWSSPEDDGGCKIGSFIVEYFRMGWDMWLKAQNSRQLSTILEDLIEGSEYKFRVRAENPYGTSDPSEESDVIFIPDIKRGILKPPQRKEIEVVKEPKRHVEETGNVNETEESKKRRLLEEKAKKLLDTPLSVLLPYENKPSDRPGKRKTASSTESFASVDENVPPPVPKRRHKRSTPSPIDPTLLDRSVTSSPIGGRLTPSSLDSLPTPRTPSPIERGSNRPSPMDPSLLDRSATASPIRNKLTPSPLDLRLSDASITSSPTQKRSNTPIHTDPILVDSSAILSHSPVDLSVSPQRTPSPVLKIKANGSLRNSETGSSLKNSHLKFEERDPYNIEAPMYPRENDDSIMHGSSELMLVIYPRDRSKSVELSAQQRSEIEISLAGDGVAPPMSLSAPELGGIESLELPPMREAISSSELLYERTMARLYQDTVEEESQKVVKRRYSMDRKSVERRASLKETLAERRLSWKESQAEKESSKERSPEKSSRIPVKKTNRERLSSVEKEQLEFALVRERLKKKEEARIGFINQQQFSDTTTPTTTSSSVETGEFDAEYEDDEYLEEEEEEDYLDEKEKEESYEEDENLRPIRPRTTPNMTEFEDKGMTKPIKIAPYAVQEEDTYHPRSMIPTRSVFGKVEKPGEAKSIAESPKTALEVKTFKPTEVKSEEKTKTSKIPVVAPAKSKKTSKILKKFGLKKDKKVPEVMTAPIDPNQPPAVVPKPILKNKIPIKKKESSKISLRLSPKPAEKSISEEESESEIPGKKKKVRISEPNETKETKIKEKPVDENAKENQVLIFHYSDIVKEFGGPKKPPSKLYLNYDELKAHAKPEVPEQVNKVYPKEIKVPTVSKPSEMKVKKENPMIVVTPAEEPPPKVTTQQPKGGFSTLEYATDVVMFIIACWLYLFKNELYAIPILFIMAYRQLKDLTIEKYTKIKNSIANRLPARFTRRSGNEEFK